MEPVVFSIDNQHFAATDDGTRISKVVAVPLSADDLLAVFSGTFDFGGAISIEEFEKLHADAPFFLVTRIAQAHLLS